MPLSDLYTADEIAWLEKSAKLIGAGKHDALDYEHLQEVLQDMAIRERREVKSRLVTLIIHVLKWEFQAAKRTRNWLSTIHEQQRELRFTLEDSATLRNHAVAILADAYGVAVRYAAEETELRKDRFPQTCPYSVDELLSKEVSL